MSITKQDYSAHKDVVFMTFGAGDIMFTRARQEDMSEDNMLLFSNQSPHEIGSESDEYTGKTSDDIPDVKVVIVFNKPESITALIHSLVELQKSVFKGQKSLACV
jgi:hypothetical protein